jgi:hypothetical protein
MHDGSFSWYQFGINDKGLKAERRITFHFQSSPGSFRGTAPVLVAWVFRLDFWFLKLTNGQAGGERFTRGVTRNEVDRIAKSTAGRVISEQRELFIRELISACLQLKFEDVDFVNNECAATSENESTFNPSRVVVRRSKASALASSRLTSTTNRTDHRSQNNYKSSMKRKPRAQIVRILQREKKTSNAGVEILDQPNSDRPSVSKRMESPIQERRSPRTRFVQYPGSASEFVLDHRSNDGTPPPKSYPCYPATEAAVLA